MALNFTSLLNSMMAAVKPTLAGFGKTAASILALTKNNLRSVAMAIAEAGNDLVKGLITKAEAKDIVRDAKKIFLSQIALVDVMIKAQAQKVINAAIGAVKGAVNAAIGVALL